MKRLLLICSVLILLTAGIYVSYAGGETPVQSAARVPAAEVKGNVDAARQGWALIDQGALLIDVRSASEHESGHIDGSLNIPHSEIDALVNAIGTDKERKVVLYCRSGRRVGAAQKQLEALGYNGIFNASGFEALQVTKP